MASELLNAGGGSLASVDARTQMPPPPVPLQKRPSSFGRTDDLPNPRRFSFKRKLQTDIEGRFRDMLASVPIVKSSSSSASPMDAVDSGRCEDNSGRPADSPLGVKLVLGRIVGGGGQRDVVLPFVTEAILDGSGYTFDPTLSSDEFEWLRSIFECKFDAQKSSETSQLEPSDRRTRWADVSKEERHFTVVAELPTALATFYQPGSHWHYQLRSAALPVTAQNAKLEETDCTTRTELRFLFRKVLGSEDPAWTVSFVSEESKPGIDGSNVKDKRLWIELGLNENFLLKQKQRMHSAQPHIFSRICRDFRRNAISLADVLQNRAGTTAGEDQTAREKLFYPGIFDVANASPVEAEPPGMLGPAAAMQNFYSQRALQGSWANSERTSKIRRFNNLVKTMLLERFLDELPGKLRVLDLGCGRGQDVAKYSCENRRATVATYVGVDFASEAVEEAKRRYSDMVSKARTRGVTEYAAAFYVGDCSKADIFEQLAADGHGQFDVVVSQFALHYLVESEQAARLFLERVRKLLRPGGRFIATIPSCEVLADYYESAAVAKKGASKSTWEREHRRSFYSIRFDGQVWASKELQSSPPRDGPSGGEEPALDFEEIFQRRWGLTYTFALEGAVDAQEYVLPWESFEDLATSLGLKVFSDAPFPDLLRELKGQSPFFTNYFSRNPENNTLDQDEESLFKLYNGFVLERGEGE
ncbi:unnamed protein product [Polarella glacialis]|uniref:mRNA (guanine-N(7))-methyltransferase n=1 Tax=Polarella glacialis TaxID=89957 RepID=A0A813KQW3_POLGL|nr:unnamed protein product [Polarella glacialis]CAE8710692.1 unnamed protein product [Polarella glacialis]